MSHDFAQSMREIETMKPITQEELNEVKDAILNMADIDNFYCDDTEYETRYLDGVIPVLVPVDEDEEWEDDEI